MGGISAVTKMQPVPLTGNLSNMGKKTEERNYTRIYHMLSVASILFVFTMGLAIGIAALVMV